MGRVLVVIVRFLQRGIGMSDCFARTWALDVKIDGEKGFTIPFLGGSVAWAIDRAHEVSTWYFESVVEVRDERSNEVVERIVRCFDKSSGAAQIKLVTGGLDAF